MRQHEELPEVGIRAVVERGVERQCFPQAGGRGCRHSGDEQRKEAEAKDVFHESPQILQNTGRGASKCLGNLGTALTLDAEGTIPTNPPKVNKPENIPREGNPVHGRSMTTENFGENRFRLVHHKGSGGHPYVVAEAVPHRGSPKPVTAAPIKHGRGILKRKLGEKPLPKEIAIHWLT